MDTFPILIAAVFKISLWLVPCVLLAFAINHFFGEQVDRLLGVPPEEEIPDNVVPLPTWPDDDPDQHAA